jgi:hypothetical protein
MNSTRAAAAASATQSNPTEKHIPRSELWTYKWNKQLLHLLSDPIDFTSPSVLNTSEIHFKCLFDESIRLQIELQKLIFESNFIHEKPSRMNEKSILSLQTQLKHYIEVVQRIKAQLVLENIHQRTQIQSYEQKIHELTKQN